ncbi:MAG: helix-turn-helix transcriptional regulator [Arachnia sp.]
METSDDRNRRLLRARDTMDRCFAEDLTVPGLARIALMGREHFIREFKKVFGETPYRYLQRRRIERAMQMLRWSERTVTDICMAVGFSSLGTFSRTFTEIVGQTPSEYRASTDRPASYVPELFTMRWRRPAGDDHR